MKLGTLVKLLLLSLISVQLAQANGGGYSFGVNQTGQPLAFDMEGVGDVRMVEEYLDIHLLPDEALVGVRYLMLNEGKKTKVRFGFPVEGGAPFTEFGPVAEQPDPLAVPPGLKNYQVSLNGQKLKVTWKPEELNEIYSRAEVEGLAGWLVSEATFPAESKLELKISYQVEHKGTVMHVSDDTRASAKTFKYRFSTGAVWKGPIKKGLVTISIGEGLNRDFMEIRKPVNRFQKNKSGWTWAFEDFEPTLADDLEIAVTPEFEIRGNYREDNGGIQAYVRRGTIWAAENSYYDVEASSTLPDEGGNSYKAENLKTWQEESKAMVWSEGKEGDGAGEWVLIKPKKAERLVGLRIAGGFQDYRRENLFKANSRPKEMVMTLNDEHVQLLEFEDEADFQIFWVEGYDKPVKSCKLMIKEVYPGEKFSDLCLKKVSILSFLEKDPKVYGAR